jgi:hypothetical protein
VTKLDGATQQISLPRKYLSYARYDAAMAIAEDLEVAPFLKSEPKKLFIGGRWVEFLVRLASVVADGTIYVNCCHIVDPVTPWGGYKQSGGGASSAPTRWTSTQSSRT